MIKVGVIGVGTMGKHHARVYAGLSDVELVGVVIDLATHDIDLIRYLTNSGFKKIYSLTSKNISKNENFAILSFEMKNGVLTHITTNWLTPFKI